MSQQARGVTAEELFQYSDSEDHELIRGVPRVSEPPGGIHGSIAARIVARLGGHVERHHLGTVLVEAGYILRRGPDTVRGPDVSFISVDRLSPDRIPEQFIPGAPDLAVEILSPSSRWSEVEERIADFLAAGTRLVWMVIPGEGRAIARYPDRPPKVLAAEESLEGGDVVPGFALPLADLFGSP